jgi:hypothetical protein
MIQVFSNNSALLKLAAMSPLNKGGGEIARGTSNVARRFSEEENHIDGKDGRIPQDQGGRGRKKRI